MHIFFRYCVADLVWKEISRVSGLNVSPADYEKIAGLWLCDKKHEVNNVCHAAVMWVL